MKLENALSLIRDIPDYPKPGILFKDITPLLADPSAFSAVIKAFTAQIDDAEIIAGIEARGFIFAAAIAQARAQVSYPFERAASFPLKPLALSTVLNMVKMRSKFISMPSLVENHWSLLMMS